MSKPEGKKDKSKKPAAKVLEPSSQRKFNAIKTGQVKAFRDNFQNHSQEKYYDNITGKEHLRGFDWYIFPSGSQTHQDANLDYEDPDDQTVYEALCNDPGFADLYLKSIEIYLQACEVIKPPFGGYPVRYCKMVQSFIGLTNHNARLIRGLNQDKQNGLFRRASALMSYQDPIDSQHQRSLKALSHLTEIIIKIDEGKQGDKEYKSPSVPSDKRMEVLYGEEDLITLRDLRLAQAISGQIKLKVQNNVVVTAEDSKAPTASASVAAAAMAPPALPTAFIADGYKTYIIENRFAVSSNDAGRLIDRYFNEELIRIKDLIEKEQKEAKSASKTKSQILFHINPGGHWVCGQILINENGIIEDIFYHDSLGQHELFDQEKLPTTPTLAYIVQKALFAQIAKIFNTSKITAFSRSTLPKIQFQDGDQCCGDYSTMLMAHLSRKPKNPSWECIGTPLDPLSRIPTGFHYQNVRQANIDLVTKSNHLRKSLFLVDESKSQENTERKKQAQFAMATAKVAEKEIIEAIRGQDFFDKNKISPDNIKNAIILIEEIIENYSSDFFYTIAVAKLKQLATLFPIDSEIQKYISTKLLAGDKLNPEYINTIIGMGATSVRTGGVMQPLRRELIRFNLGIIAQNENKKEESPLAEDMVRGIIRNNEAIFGFFFNDQDISELPKKRAAQENHIAECIKRAKTDSKQPLAAAGKIFDVRKANEFEKLYKRFKADTADNILYPYKDNVPPVLFEKLRSEFEKLRSEIDTINKKFGLAKTTTSLAIQQCTSLEEFDNIIAKFNELLDSSTNAILKASELSKGVLTDLGKGTPKEGLINAFVIKCNQFEIEQKAEQKKKESVDKKRQEEKQKAVGAEERKKQEETLKASQDQNLKEEEERKKQEAEAARLKELENQKLAQQKAEEEEKKKKEPDEKKEQTAPEDPRMIMLYGEHDLEILRDLRLAQNGLIIDDNNKVISSDKDVKASLLPPPSPTSGSIAAAAVAASVPIPVGKKEYTTYIIKPRFELPKDEYSIGILNDGFIAELKKIKAAIDADNKASTPLKSKTKTQILFHINPGLHWVLGQILIHEDDRIEVFYHDSLGPSLESNPTKDYLLTRINEIFGKGKVVGFSRSPLPKIQYPEKNDLCCGDYSTMLMTHLSTNPGNLSWECCNLDVEEKDKKKKSSPPIIAGIPVRFSYKKLRAANIDFVAKSAHHDKGKFLPLQTEKDIKRETESKDATRKAQKIAAEIIGKIDEDLFLNSASPDNIPQAIELIEGIMITVKNNSSDWRTVVTANLQELITLFPEHSEITRFISETLLFGGVLNMSMIDTIIGGRSVDGSIKIAGVMQPLLKGLIQQHLRLIAERGNNGTPPLAKEKIDFILEDSAAIFNYFFDHPDIDILPNLRKAQEKNIAAYVAKEKASHEQKAPIVPKTVFPTTQILKAYSDFRALASPFKMRKTYGDAFSAAVEKLQNNVEAIKKRIDEARLTMQPTILDFNSLEDFDKNITQFRELLNDLHKATFAAHKLLSETLEQLQLRQAHLQKQEIITSFVIKCNQFEIEQKAEQKEEEEKKETKNKPGELVVPDRSPSPIINYRPLADRFSDVAITQTIRDYITPPEAKTNSESLKSSRRAISNQQQEITEALEESLKLPKDYSLGKRKGSNIGMGLELAPAKFQCKITDEHEQVTEGFRYCLIIEGVFAADGIKRFSKKGISLDNPSQLKNKYITNLREINERGEVTEYLDLEEIFNRHIKDIDPNTQKEQYKKAVNDAAIEINQVLFRAGNIEFTTIDKDSIVETYSCYRGLETIFTPDGELYDVNNHGIDMLSGFRENLERLRKKEQSVEI